MYSKNTVMRQHRYHFVHLAICNLATVLLITLVRPAYADEGFRDGYEGHGTVHEQLGQVHFPPAILTEFKPKLRYLRDYDLTTMGMSYVYSFVHWLFDLIYDASRFPPGYVVIKNNNTAELGPKANENDWVDLLAYNKFIILLWVLPLLIIIFVVPFFAVCYCCFCACRCRKICTPCAPSRSGLRILFSLLLLLLIVGILIGFLIAFLTNKQMNRGFLHAAHRMRRGGQNTCDFLKDVNAHIQHLFVENYKELEEHLIDQTEDAYKHILLDLSDTSDSNAINELERIFDNLPRALVIMKQIDEMEKNLRFLGSTFRDGLRGVKRDAIHSGIVLCDTYKCLRYIRGSRFYGLDHSKCLHYDLVPNTTVFVEVLENSIKLKLPDIPRKALERLAVISKTLKDAMDPIVPPLTKKLDRAGSNLKYEAETIQNYIDAAISDVYLKTMRSAQTFDDIQHSHGGDRVFINILVCLIIGLILILLIAGLIFGLFLRKTNTGSNIMILAVLLTFCVLSFIMLVGLFYFIIGLVAYEGACSKTDINLSYLEDNSNLEHDKPPVEQMIKACRADQNIFDFLGENGIYDIHNLKDIDIVNTTNDDDVKWNEYTGDLTKVVLISEAERKLINETIHKMKKYRSKIYMDHLCKEISPTNLRVLAQDYYDSPIRLVLWLMGPPNIWWKHNWFYAHTSSVFIFRDFSNYIQMEKIIIKLLGRIEQKLLLIEDLILGDDVNFGETIEQLLNAVKKSETFIQTRGTHFINTIGKNLTNSLEEQLVAFKAFLLEETTTNVGSCKPIAYLYVSDIVFICQHLIDPINGFWLGVLICALLLIPLLFVAHRLICLYGVYPATAPVLYLVPGAGCPTCTGAPHARQQTCSGGQQIHEICECTEDFSMHNKSKRD